MASALFSPITLRGLTLPNRIVVSPMCQYSSDNGTATDWHLMHLGSMSLGAAALVMTEMTNVTPAGRITPKCAGLWSDENEAGLKRVIDFCKTYGVARQGIQLAHAGRKGSTEPPLLGGRPLAPGIDGGWQTEAPSALPYGPDWPVPAEMSRARLQTLIGEFVSAVERAERIGYDLVELHGGHGYLVHQFLSPLSNQRRDDYGGSLASRMRFPLELFAAMRAAWPADKPMGIRVSATDWVDGGWTPDETVAFARELEQRGCDYMDVSSGGLDLRQKLPLAPAYQTPFARKVRTEAGIPTMTVGLITDPALAEDIVAGGRADMVALGRGVMWDPRWAWHAAEALGVETEYAPKMKSCHPALRPQVFPRRQTPA
ncbi:MAG: oxidoreductase [Acidobacteria bacterium RIFCSPLOWO2_02_FULL_68_18]|nr:MAG: oxidoreductase [Acidobacteria bacterium RIFCSPLOWO2_02_FULL_68_18]OFW48703.1 MAG: oxidoreductase [Acidobacteria bacterium RIFCSPLOWO2_12_FULL_68_19]